MEKLTIRYIRFALHGPCFGCHIAAGPRPAWVPRFVFARLSCQIFQTDDPERNPMSLQYFAGAAYRTLTARKDGPSLYDVCDPLLRSAAGGDQHIGQFYRTALGNPALRTLLHRPGLPELNEPARLNTLRDALVHARDDASPDWEAIGRPVADLLDSFTLHHPQPARTNQAAAIPSAGAIDRVISACGAHLLGSFTKNGFIPTYAAFNLIGDPDVRGRECLMALTGLNARGYKNSTLL